ncbi:MAG: hypothetical protein AB7G25_05390 [Sphingomonadaceae bacterium]
MVVPEEVDIDELIVQFERRELYAEELEKLTAQEADRITSQARMGDQRP